jgi:hypothetical protein
MLIFLGRLAAAVRSSRRAKIAGAAASFLILALILGGCGGLIEPIPGSRFFRILADLWKLLPEVTPKSPYELVVGIIGEDYHKKLEIWLLMIVQPPVLDDGLFSDLLLILRKLVVPVMIALAIVKYFYLLLDYAGREGIQKVWAGATHLVSPPNWFFRFIAVIFVVGSAIVIVSVSLRAMSDFVVATGLSLYYGQDTTIREVIDALVRRMLDGMQVWMFIISLVCLLVGGLILVGVLLWRWLLTFVGAARILIFTPQYLDGESPMTFVKPLVDVTLKVVNLGVMWFCLLIIPLITIFTAASGFPMALALITAIALAIWAPFLFFKLTPLGLNKYAPGFMQRVNRSLAPIDRVRRTEGVAVSPTADLPFHQRLWEHVPSPIRATVGFGGEIIKRHPTTGPVIATTAAILDRVKRTTKGDVAEAIVQRTAGRSYRPPPASHSPRPAGNPHPRAPRNTSRSSSIPGIDDLREAAIRSGLSQKKSTMTDEVYGLSAVLVITGSPASSDEALIELAEEQLRGLSKEQREDYERAGSQLRRST